MGKYIEIEIIIRFQVVELGKYIILKECCNLLNNCLDSC